jgi:hypothetical protein
MEEGEASFDDDESLRNGRKYVSRKKSSVIVQGVFVAYQSRDLEIRESKAS